MGREAEYSAKQQKGNWTYQYKGRCWEWKVWNKTSRNFENLVHFFWDCLLSSWSDKDWLILIPEVLFFSCLSPNPTHPSHPGSKLTSHRKSLHLQWDLFLPSSDFAGTSPLYRPSLMHRLYASLDESLIFQGQTM